MMKNFLRLSAICGGLLTILTACSGTVLLNALASSDGYTVQRDIPYVTVGENNPRQMLDIYVPTKPDAGHSVVLFFYGGSWQFGSKDQYLFFAQALTERGYTVVVANYRLAPEVHFPAFLDDSAAALVWTHQHIANYGGNPARLFIAGHSAGAYNAMMLTLNDNYVKKAGGTMDMIHGTIGISGPYKFLPLQDDNLAALFGGAERPETEAYTFADHRTSPMLLATGTDDDLVDPEHTTLMAARQRELGTDVTTHYYEGTGHIGIILSTARGFRSKTTLLQDISSFVDSH